MALAVVARVVRVRRRYIVVVDVRLGLGGVGAGAGRRRDNQDHHHSNMVVRLSWQRNHAVDIPRPQRRALAQPGGPMPVTTRSLTLITGPVGCTRRRQSSERAASSFFAKNTQKNRLRAFTTALGRS